MSIYFSEYFGIDRAIVDNYGAFDISIVTDLPLFIDPFLLFNSTNTQYQKLHDEIINYLKFLRKKSGVGSIMPGLVQAWYKFPEVKQTWLGFTATGNAGRGLGTVFADALHQNLNNIFQNFGNEQITKGSHLEKLCLIKENVGKDYISDFTTNLIKEFLCEYTQSFAKSHLNDSQCRLVAVPKVKFNYDTEVWEPRKFFLPWIEDDFVLITPKEILTKDDTWINKNDLIKDFDEIPDSIPNMELRAQVNRHFLRMLATKEGKDPTKKEKREAAIFTVRRFPQTIDYYILHKEKGGEQARSISTKHVKFSEILYLDHCQLLRNQLSQNGFYELPEDTYEESHKRVKFFRDVIENKGGYRLFYVEGKPIPKESDVHIMFRLVWYGTRSDVSREVNDGRGPADFKISRGSQDKTIIEFKLARNTHLKRNLQKQAEIYQKASDAKNKIKVIVYFSEDELEKISKILNELGLVGNPDIVLIDASNDNKPSASAA